MTFGQYRFVVLVLLSTLALAATRTVRAEDPADGAFLDPQYPALSHPIDDAAFNKDLLPVRSDVESVLKFQTPVRSQGSRGTCSIFSATALLEGLLVQRGAIPRTADLSEEWLEYLVMRNSYGDGSTSLRNFSTYARYGAIEERYLPYIGETWEDASSGLAAERCAKARRQQQCLLGHRDPDLLDATDEQLSAPGSALYDPEFLKARRRAATFKASKLGEVESAYSVSSVSEAKSLLASGTAINLDLDFYYGAWNHRKGAELGLNRNLDQWVKGIVTYPEPGSLDEKVSRPERAGHSITVVGYDDDVVVENTVQMVDGTTKSVRYKGVYYFKNSWGTTGFGTQTMVGGVLAPGYGVITQKYAHEYGAFYRFPLPEKVR